MTESEPGRQGPYLFVHGSWHGAWAFERTIATMAGLGREAFAIDLPGHGLDQHPTATVTLDDYIARIVDAIDLFAVPVTVVAHSMGGVPVTSAVAARPHKARRIVYVAAFVPRNGQTLMELAASDDAAEVYPNLVASADGATTYFARDAARHVFYGDCNTIDAAWATLRLGPQPVAPYLSPVTIGPEGDAIEKVYVRTGRDRAVSPALQDRMIEANNLHTVVQFDSDHSPFLSHTDEFCAALVATED